MREERREKERREDERYLLIRWYCGRLPCKINTNSGRLTIRRTNFKHRPPCNPKKCPFLLLFLSFFTFLIFICWYLIELAAPRRFSALLSLQSDFSPLNDASVNWHPARTARYWGRFSFFFFGSTAYFLIRNCSKAEKSCCHPLIQRVTSLGPTKRGEARRLFILGWRGGGFDIHLGTKTSQASLRLESAALALLISGVVVEEGGGGGGGGGGGRQKMLSSAIAI